MDSADHFTLAFFLGTITCLTIIVGQALPKLQSDELSGCNVSNVHATLNTSLNSSFLTCTVQFGGQSGQGSRVECVDNSSFRIFLSPNDARLIINCSSSNAVRVQYELLDSASSNPKLQRQIFNSNIIPGDGVWTFVYTIDIGNQNVSTRYTVTATTNMDVQAVLAGPLRILVLFPSEFFGVQIYSPKPKSAFVAHEDVVLVPCLSHLPPQPFVYDVQGNGDSESISRLLPPTITHDPKRGVLINASQLVNYAEHTFLCCPTERGAGAQWRPRCAQFLLEDPPDLVVSPLMPSGDEILRIFGKERVPILLELVCSAWEPLRLNGTSGSSLRPSEGETHFSARVRQTRFQPQARFLGSSRLSIDVHDWIRAECVSLESGEVLYRWNILAHDVAPDDFSSSPSYLRLDASQTQPGKPNAGSLSLRCYTEMNRKAQLQFIACHNELECLFVAPCFEAECQSTVHYGYECVNGNYGNGSCQELSVPASGLLRCTAGDYSFQQLRWVGLSGRESYTYEPAVLLNPTLVREMIQISIEPAGWTTDANDLFYTRMRYKLTCEVNPFWSDGKLYIFVGYLDRSPSFLQLATGLAQGNGTLHKLEVEVTFNTTAINRVVCRAPHLEANDVWIWANSGQITVLDPSEPAILNNQTNIKLADDDDVKVVDCQAAGRPPPYMSWIKIQSGGNVSISTNSAENIHVANKSRLTFRKFTKELEGTYRCGAKNEFGEASMNFVLSMRPDVKVGGTVPAAAYIGGVAAAAAVILLVVGGLVYNFVLRRRRVLDQSDVDNFLHGQAVDGADQREDDGGDLDSRMPRSSTSGIDELPWDQRLEISRNNFIVDKSRRLGAGEFGKVYEGSLVSDGNCELKVAIKVPRRNCPETILISLLKEVKIMSYLEHENVVSLVGANTKNAAFGNLYILMEFCEEGSLDQCFRKWNYTANITERTAKASHYTHWPATFSFKDLLQWSTDMAAGMEFLASKGIVHRDLAARNILLTATRQAKVSDFGLSRLLYGNPTYEQKSMDLMLPARWMAVECFTGTFSTESDVWAYGILVWEIFSLGQLPYSGVEFAEAAQFAIMLRNGMRISEMCHATQEIFDKMCDCWRTLQAERPSFTELKAFFSRLYMREHQLSDP